MSATYDTYEARCSDDSDVPAASHNRRTKTTAPGLNPGAADNGRTHGQGEE